MIGLLKRYTRWLHTQWPAGNVERLPQAREDGSTNVSGLYIVGDLTGTECPAHCSQAVEFIHPALETLA